MEDVAKLEDHGWDQNLRAIWFWMNLDGVSHRCLVSEQSLRLLTDLDRPSRDVPADEMFTDRSSKLVEIATKKIRDGQFDEDGNVIISKRDVRPDLA